jgi:hypothetical protein
VHSSENGGDDDGGGSSCSASSITNKKISKNGHQQQQAERVIANNITRRSFCDLCRRKFYSYNFLRNHMKKIHGIRLPRHVVEGEESNPPPPPPPQNQLQQPAAQIKSASSSALLKTAVVNQQKPQPKTDLNLSSLLKTLAAAGKNQPAASQEEQLTTLLGSLITNLVQQQQQQQKSPTHTADQTDEEEEDEVNDRSISIESSKHDQKVAPVLQQQPTVTKCTLCGNKFPTRAVFKKHLLIRHRLTYQCYLARTTGSTTTTQQQQHQSGSLKQAPLVIENNRGVSQNNSENGQRLIPNSNHKSITVAPAENGRKRKNSASSCSALSTASSNNSTGDSHSNNSKKSRLGGAQDPTSEMASQLSDVLALMKRFYSANETATLAAAAEKKQSMQAFIIEDEGELDDDDNCGFRLMQPCVVYLPVTGRVDTACSLKIKLKPVDRSNKSLISPGASTATSVIKKETANNSQTVAVNGAITRETSEEFAFCDEEENDDFVENTDLFRDDFDGVEDDDEAEEVMALRRRQQQNTHRMHLQQQLKN